VIDLAGVVTLTRRLFKLACRSLITRHVPWISTPRMLRADGIGGEGGTTAGWYGGGITGCGLHSDLGSHTSEKIAARLKEFDVRFILHTSNWPEIQEFVASTNVPVVFKPSLPADIVDKLSES
jgi:hypothetical protein